MKTILFSLLALSIVAHLSAQDTISLYANGIPNSKPTENKEKSVLDGIVRISHVSQPRLLVFLPPKEKANGTTVIICPGGGYWILASSHEGTDVAKAFNEWGVTAFVLLYRLPDDSIMPDKEIGPLQDAQRAVQLVRLDAEKYNIDKNKIGIMGFSAGGHLASTEGTHFNHPVIEKVKDISLRPNFMILIYPVISFTDSIGHIGSRDNLLGKNPSAKKIKYYSNELQVTKNTPPTFLVHAKDDDVVKVANSLDFYAALQKESVPSEIHLYEHGGHGFGMNNKKEAGNWMDWLKTWMKKNDWVK